MSTRSHNDAPAGVRMTGILHRYVQANGRVMAVIGVLALLLPASPLPLLAALQSDAAAGPPEMATGGVLLKLILALVAVLVLILLLQKAARRWGGSFQAGGGSESIRIVSSRSVGPRMSLALVQVMNRTLLVGISPQGIRQVADLGAAEGLSAGTPLRATQQRGAAPVTGGILGRLAGMLSRERLATGGTAEPAELGLQMLSEADERPGERSGEMPGRQDEPEDRPGGFEGELSRRLGELRRKYATISDLEAGLEGGRP